MTTTTTDPVDWARHITDEFKSIGYTVEGMPEHLTREQAIKLLEGVQRQIAEWKAQP